MKLTKSFSVLAINISLLCAMSQVAVAKDEEYQRLENRITQLENMLAELKKELKAQSSDHQESTTQTHSVVKQTTTPSPKPLIEPQESHTYAFGGFIKTSASFSSYTDGDVPAASPGRDFYIPGTVPVGGDNESTDFDFGAKESRITFKSDHSLQTGDKISTYLEMDFLLTPGGNERVSNSYAPRLRHAYIKYNNLLVGQAWSTFQNLGALVESVDFLGASEGTVFQRQSMIRYTHGPWQFALENPETTITPFGGGVRIVSDDNSYPDLVVRYDHKKEWGHVTLAGLLRTLEYDIVGNNESETSFGLSFSGRYNIGTKDDVRFMLSSGKGMGRYMGLNTANGAVLTDTGELESIDSTGGYVAYRHFWNEQWRSNFSYSHLDIDNDAEYTGLGVTKSSKSAQINLLYSPTAKLTLGLGWLYAKRTLESRVDGELNRMIFSARYNF